MLYFILGILFVEAVSPVIESAVTLVLAHLEVFKGKASLEVAKINNEISKIKDVDEEPQRAIGFVLPEDIEVEEDDDE